MKNLTEDSRFPAKIQTRDLPLERIIHNDDQKKKKSCGRNRLPVILMYYRSTYLGLRKTTKNLRQDNQYPCQDLNLRRPAYSAGMVTTRGCPVQSLTEMGKTVRVANLTQFIEKHDSY